MSPLPLAFFLSWPSSSGLAADFCVEYRVADFVRLYGSLFLKRQENYDGEGHQGILYALFGVRVMKDWAW